MKRWEDRADRPQWRERDDTNRRPPSREPEGGRLKPLPPLASGSRAGRRPAYEPDAEWEREPRCCEPPREAYDADASEEEVLYEPAYDDRRRGERYPRPQVEAPAWRQPRRAEAPPPCPPPVWQANPYPYAPPAPAWQPEYPRYQTPGANIVFQVTPAPAPYAAPYAAPMPSPYPPAMPAPYPSWQWPYAPYPQQPPATNVIVQCECPRRAPQPSAPPYPVYERPSAPSPPPPHAKAHRPHGRMHPPHAVRASEAPPPPPPAERPQPAKPEPFTPLPERERWTPPAPAEPLRPLQPPAQPRPEEAAPEEQRNPQAGPARVSAGLFPAPRVLPPRPALRPEAPRPAMPAPFAPPAPRKADAAGARAAYYDGIGMPPAFEPPERNEWTPPAFETVLPEQIAPPPEAPEPPANEQPPYDRRVEYEPPETEAWASRIPEETVTASEEAGQPPYESDGFAAQADLQPAAPEPETWETAQTPGEERPPYDEPSTPEPFTEDQVPQALAAEEESAQPAEETQAPEATAEEPAEEPAALQELPYEGPAYMEPAFTAVAAPEPEAWEAPQTPAEERPPYGEPTLPEPSAQEDAWAPQAVSAGEESAQPAEETQSPEEPAEAIAEEPAEENAEESAEAIAEEPAEEIAEAPATAEEPPYSEEAAFAEPPFEQPAEPEPPAWEAPQAQADERTPYEEPPIPESPATEAWAPQPVAEAGSKAEPPAWESPVPEPEPPAPRPAPEPPFSRSIEPAQPEQAVTEEPEQTPWPVWSEGREAPADEHPFPDFSAPAAVPPVQTRGGAPAVTAWNGVATTTAEAIPAAPEAQPEPEAAEQPSRDEDEDAEEDEPPSRDAFRSVPAPTAPGGRDAWAPVPPKELPEPMPVSTSEPEDRPQKRRRSGVVRWVFAGVVVVALAAALYQSGLWTQLTRPATNEATVEGLATVAPTAEQITAAAAATAEAAAEGAVALNGVSLALAEGTAPVTLVFTLKTNAAVSAVRLMSESGVMFPTTARSTPLDDGLKWTVSADFETAYSGRVRIFLCDQDGAWSEASQTCTVNVT